MKWFRKRTETNGRRWFGRDSFKRDIGVLLVASVLIGAVVAGAVSYGANMYFQETLTSMVGEYGEYDLILQIREEVKADGQSQLDHIIRENLPGTRYKEGPPLAGRANFFLALPAAYKTKEVFENIDAVFASVPGISGVSVITEPRLAIRGVPAGAAERLMRRLGAIEGVHFVFRDGSNVSVVLRSIEDTAAVKAAVESILSSQRVIEIGFPAGAEPENPVRLAEAIGNDIYAQLQPSVVEYVSLDDSENDMAYTASIMQELKKFLLAYAAKVEIAPGGAALAKGDTVVFQGAAASPPAAGASVERGHVVVEITGYGGGGKAEGMIRQGDVSLLKDKRGYKIENGLIGPAVGAATYTDPRRRLGGALADTAAIVSQVPDAAREAQSISRAALDAAERYAANAPAIEKTLGRVADAADMLGAAALRLEGMDVAAAKGRLDASADSMDGLIGTLRLLKVLNPEAGAAIDALKATQENLRSFSGLLNGVGQAADGVGAARAALEEMAQGGAQAMAFLESAGGARETIAALERRLQGLGEMDAAGTAAQLKRLAQSVPAMKDEEIYHAVRLMDRLIQGQVIPRQRIQLLVDGVVGAEAVKPIVYARVGHQNVGVFSSALGVIEPNTHLQVYQLLREVQAVLAGLTAMAATAALLALDHTAVMAVLKRRRRLPDDAHGGGPAGWLRRFRHEMTAPDRLYGAAVGAALLSGMFFLAGGGIPYLPWYGVMAVGALLGLFISVYAAKINPAPGDEIMAGESLGLSFDEIMREIVIPGGRPGLMQRLNRRNMKFT